jgi:tetratricopeptide (TPR) repeat protein
MERYALLAALIVPAVLQADWSQSKTAGQQAYLAGHYAEAEQLLTAARNEAADPEQKALASSDLAAVYQALGRYSEAETLLRQCPPDGVILSRLASVYADEQKYDQSRASAGAALKLVPHESLAYTATLRTIGDLDLKTGNAKDAEAVFSEAREVDSRVSPDRLPVDIAGIARSKARQGQLREGEKLFKRALALPQEKDVAYGIRLNNFGQLEMALGKPRKAETAFRSAVTIWKQAFGDEHPLVKAGLLNLAQAEAAGVPTPNTAVASADGDACLACESMQQRRFPR